MDFVPFTLNIHGELREYNRPLVMGIVNVTPDSFYAGSRVSEKGAIVDRVEGMIAAGVDMIDLGAYSSRPGADDVNAEEEVARLRTGMEAIRSVSPDILVSIDTFRSEVARTAVCELGADIINDISGGDLDGDMWSVVADLKVPYVLMHMRGTPATMQSLTEYDDVTADVIKDLSVKLRELRLRGVADVIIDPGFGFSKTLEQNFEMMKNLELFSQALDAPVLVGISRKSMITKSLGVAAEDALAGTIALNTIALMRGASIIRVHDVPEAVSAVKMFSLSN
ncbi:MAG: dihydropteroate synthase [Duncaniella sp.]|nr:dihydropteroate synthase [Duncaniella sp.]